MNLHCAFTVIYPFLNIWEYRVTSVNHYVHAVVHLSAVKMLFTLKCNLFLNFLSVGIFLINYCKSKSIQCLNNICILLAYIYRL